MGRESRFASFFLRLTVAIYPFLLFVCVSGEVTAEQGRGYRAIMLRNGVGV